MRKALTARDINEKLSEGWGYTQMAAYMDCTVDELKEFINRGAGFNRRARQDFRFRFERNEKAYQRQLKRSNKAKGSVACPSDSVVGVEQPVDQCVVMVRPELLAMQVGVDATKHDVDKVCSEAPGVSEVSGTSGMPGAPACDKKVQTGDKKNQAGDEKSQTGQNNRIERKDQAGQKLLELEKLETEFVQKIGILEEQEKKLRMERVELKESLCPLEQEFRQMKMRLLGMRKQIETVRDRLGEIAAELETTIFERSEREARLAEIQMELELSQVTEIYVDGDGQMADGDGVVIAVSDGWEPVFLELRDSELAEDCTIKEIRLAAQILVTITQFPRYTLLVESEHVATLLAQRGVECC